jgi:hypothetical protein
MAACDAGTGACVAPPVANGIACNDSDACTQTDTCQAGTCTGANLVTCAAPDQCHTAGTCNSATGLCSNPAKVDGTSCNDGNACTQTDVCQAGTCTGSNPVVCAALDACHEAGSCDSQSGTCSTPPKPSDTICGPAQCSGSTLNAFQVCDGNGTCQPGKPQDCAPFGCAAGACQTICTGAAECAMGATCVAGLCTFDSSTTSTGASTGTGTGTGTSASTGTGTDTGGGAGEDTPTDGGCGACDIGRDSSNGAPWIGLGLLLALRRRRQRARAGAAVR